MAENLSYFPIMVDLKRYPALVIGGGPVAYRKTMNLLDYGANVKVISLEFIADFDELIKSKKIEHEQRAYRKGDLKDFRLIFCATNDSKTDKRVFEDAEKLGKLCNIADIPPLCNFIMPSNFKRGDFIVALSTQGKAPFYVKEKRVQLERFFSPMVSDVTDLAGEFRKKLLNDYRFDTPIKRYELFQRFLSIHWEEILYHNGMESARDKMNKLFEE